MDIDDWAKEDCVCGHRRYAHGIGGRSNCTRTVKRKRADPSWPLAQYDATDEDPFSAAINWPPYEEWPETVEPCSCTGFAEPEPDEPW